MDHVLKQEALLSLRQLLPIGPKTIFFDPDVIDVINLIVDTKTLRQWQVEKFHILDNDPPSKFNKNIIYIIKPSIKMCLQVSNYVKQLSHIIFVRHKNIQCERIFEAAGIWRHLTISVLPITFLPVPYSNVQGIISMENNGLRRTIVDHDNLPLLQAADALMHLQDLFGIIPVIQGIGYQSLFITKQLTQSTSYECSTIGRLIMIDRECDLVTPLLSPITYSGLIDKPPQDIVYKKLQHLNIYGIGKIMNELLKKSDYVYRHYEKDIESGKALIDMEKQYPQKLLIKHYTLVEKAIEKAKSNLTLELEQYLLLGEDLTFMPELPKYDMLRLLYLHYLTGGKHFDKIVKKMIKHHGPTFIFDHLNFIEPMNWAIIQQQFSLLPINTQNDMASVNEGYAPLSCRLVEHALLTPYKTFTRIKQGEIFQGWVKNSKVKKLKQPFFHVIQDFDFSVLDEDQMTDLSSTILIFFVGGITHAEIAALSFLQTLNPNKKIIIASTNIIKDFLQSFS